MAHNKENIEKYRKMSLDYYEGLGRSELIEELMGKVEAEIGMMDDEELEEQIREMEPVFADAPEGAEGR